MNILFFVNVHVLVYILVLSILQNWSQLYFALTFLSLSYAITT
ncbi:uncharacterized protein PWA37_001773 [Arxiozyma heterogenica]